jgi:hypothetical protein
MDKTTKLYAALFELLSNKREQFGNLVGTVYEVGIEPFDIPFVPDDLIDPLIKKAIANGSGNGYDALMNWLKDKANIVGDVNYG